MNWENIITEHKYTYNRDFILCSPVERNDLIDKIYLRFSFKNREEIENAFDYCARLVRVPRPTQKFVYQLSTLLQIEN